MDRVAPCGALQALPPLLDAIGETARIAVQSTDPATIRVLASPASGTPVERPGLLCFRGRIRVEAQRSAAATFCPTESPAPSAGTDGAHLHRHGLDVVLELGFRLPPAKQPELVVPNPRASKG